MGGLGLFDVRLALRNKVGSGRRVVLAQERVGDAGATEFEIDKPHHKFAMRPREAQIERVDGVERLRRVVVPETGQPLFVVTAPRDLARRAMLPERRTSAALGNRQRSSNMLDAGAATRGA